MGVDETPAALAGVRFAQCTITHWRPAAPFLLNMSIAVSASIRPSRSLRLVLLGYAALNLAVALALVGRWAAGIGAASVLPALSAGACALAAMLAWKASAQGEMRRRIDISGLGEIRLTVQQSLGAVPAEADVLQLLPGSTLWPHSLLLLLGSPGGKLVSVLLIWPDSLAREQFRMLSVALRVIAERDNKFVGNNKIL
ncbi:flagellar hook-length control protein [Massilia sp. P8910]|uniref:protein YgfX n=1 Tax=Massilia antarctica TaxID=2765360 RepID=UPI0006BB757F|nr:flagellar hook-length control protein [Massilia antarctica]MCY0914136.1 flagellar hook-length control protein [Massilia sp. H27-R4]